MERTETLVHGLRILDWTPPIYKNAVMSTDRKVIVISDLDGTLLDHNTYEFTAARPALDLLVRYQIPLVLNSSKTAAELLQIRQYLNNHEPFIVENGGGIYLPDDGDYKLIAFGVRREAILPVIRDLKNQLGLSFTGFAEMSDAELVAYTALDPDACKRANQRDFTEPLLWRDNEEKLQRFCTELDQHDLCATCGGRFVHVSGKWDKGDSVRWIRDYYTGDSGADTFLIALGDSENDVPMLNCADYAVIIRSPVHPPPEVRAQKLLISEHEGPAGWNECIHQCLEELEITSETL